MALYPIKIVAPCLNYNLWDGVTYTAYNQYLITPPRIYEEAINSVAHFFYEPSNDCLVAYMQFDTIHWPSWGAYLFKWKADTGEFIGREETSIFNIAWANKAGVGSYNHIYTTMKPNSKINEVPWNDLIGWESGMWSVDPSTWTPPSIYSHALVNRIDGIVCGISSMNLDIWDISSTPTRTAQMRLPNTLGYLTYENRENLWLVTNDGLIAKANYQMARWEMLSAVQDPSPDAIDYLCAFDTKRKRLAVFRRRPDATDGACQCQLEFYRPLCRVAQLTDPVPVSPLRAGEKVRFVAHLIGDTGEGIASYLINGELLEPVSGECLTPVAQTENCGAITFRYQATEACEDTLKISATITDGQDEGE